jgi:hypothetical protein
VLLVKHFSFGLSVGKGSKYETGFILWWPYEQKNAALAASSRPPKGTVIMPMGGNGGFVGLADALSAGATPGPKTPTNRNGSDVGLLKDIPSASSPFRAATIPESFIA